MNRDLRKRGDEAALYEALTTKRIAGAALDVTDPEPPLADNKLLKLDSVIVTAHSAHASDTSYVELCRRYTDNAILPLQGKWPRTVVNPQVKGKWEAKWGKR